MKIEEIKEIRQTSEVTEVNELLKKGFRIIKILSTRVHNGEYDIVTPTYILGKVE